MPLSRVEEIDDSIPFIASPPVFTRLQSNDGPFGLNEAFDLQSPINTFSLSQVKRNPIWMDIVIENQPKKRIL